jgi:hypothetical protein
LKLLGEVNGLVPECKSCWLFFRGVELERIDTDVLDLQLGSRRLCL